MALFLLIGLGLGVATSVPIGLVNAAVIDAAYRRGLRRAFGVAAGGAAADAVHSFLGVAGVGAALERYPDLPPVFLSVSAAVLLYYGALLFRSGVSGEHDPPRRGWGAGFGLGLSLTILNPAALLAWVAVGSLLAVPSPVGAAVLGAGVGAGAFVAFAGLALLTRRGAGVLRRRAPWLPRALGLALIALAAVALIRALDYVVVSPLFKGFNLSSVLIFRLIGSGCSGGAGSSGGPSTSTGGTRGGAGAATPSPRSPRGEEPRAHGRHAHPRHR